MKIRMVPHRIQPRPFKPAVQALTATLVAGILAATVPDAHAIGPLASAGHSHVHGQARLEATLEGGRLRIEAELPMETLTGFERAPRTDDERDRLARALEALRAPGMFRPSADAGCKHAGEQQRWAGGGGSALPADDAHTDLQLTHEFDCARPARLTSIDIGLFDAFSRLRRIEARVAGPAGAQARTLGRSRRVLELAR